MCILREEQSEQSCQILSRYALKRRSFKLFWRGRPNRNKKNKIGSDMRSVLYIKTDYEVWWNLWRSLPANLSLKKWFFQNRPIDYLIKLWPKLGGLLFWTTLYSRCFLSSFAPFTVATSSHITSSNIDQFFTILLYHTQKWTGNKSYTKDPIIHVSQTLPYTLSCETLETLLSEWTRKKQILAAI